MKTPSELRAEADRLENEAKAAEQSALEAEYNKYVGRAFVYVPTSRARNSIGACAVLIHSVKMEMFGPTWITSRIGYGATKNAKNIVFHDKSVDYAFNFDNRADLQEISVESFKKAASLAKTRAESFRKIIDPLYSSPPLAIDEIVDDYNEDKIDFDFPHVVLEPGDTTLVPAEYILPNKAYVISEKSVAAAINSLHRYLAELNIGSAYYQECDRYYIEQRSRRITRLLDIFKSKL
jgi:hypothetical protein